MADNFGIRPEHDGLLRDPAAPMLDYSPPPPVVPLAKRMTNFRLEGSPFSPFAIYGLLLATIVLWFLGACVLSFLGPLAALGLVGLLFAVSYYLSRQQVIREVRIGHEMCPRCGYDLRASADRCPECATPIPEEILRRRRGRERARAAHGVEHLSEAPIIRSPKRIAKDVSPIPFDDEPDAQAGDIASDNQP